MYKNEVSFCILYQILLSKVPPISRYMAFVKMQIKPKMNPKNSTKIKQIQPWQPVQGNTAETVSESRTPWTKLQLQPNPYNTPA